MNIATPDIYYALPSTDTKLLLNRDCTISHSTGSPDTVTVQCYILTNLTIETLLPDLS